MDTRQPIVFERAWAARWFHFALWMVIIAALIGFLRAVEPILLPFVLGLMVAYLLDPLAERLTRWRLSRSMATAVVTIGLFAFLGALVTWLTPILYHQMLSLIAQAPTQLHHLELGLKDHLEPVLRNLNRVTGGASADAIPSDLSEIVNNTVSGGSQLAMRIFSSGAAFVNVMALLLITPIVCFYLIRDWPSMVRRVDELLPRAYAPTIREQLRQINRTLAAYLRGQMLVMLLMTIFYVIGLSLTGLNYALILGTLAGCIVIIPYIGSLISVGLGLMVAHSQFGVETDFWLVVTVYGLGQILESQILTPKIIGDRVGLHPLWMLFGMLAGAVLLGLAGVLLAVPLTAVIGVLVKFAIARYLESPLYQA